MEHKDFLKYVEILRTEPFGIYPHPKIAGKISTDRFIYVEDTLTHVHIKSTASEKIYELPLVLVEFANHGTLRLTREVQAWNGCFV